MFLVLLRFAIGWHFLYEGTQKILSTPEGKASVLARVFPVPEGPPFSSEGYLRAASGPLAPKFRSLVPDIDSRAKLDPAKLKESWKVETDRIGAHYGFDGDQQKKAGDALKARERAVDDWFLAIENREKVKKYIDELAVIDAVDRQTSPLSYEVEIARGDRKTVEADRRELVKEVDSWTAALHDDLEKLATPDQLKEAGSYHPPMTQLEKIDLLTMWGLTAVGFCLMIGLFTPLAALGGAGYLLSFYLSMPPWPGLPEGITEGHYRYVNKNLIEMVACLVLASTPNGLWIGVDALLFGWMGRGRRREPEPVEVRTERPAPQDRRKFKTR